MGAALNMGFPDYGEAVGLATMLPFGVGNLILGALIDTLNRKRVIVGASFICSISSSCIPFVMGIAGLCSLRAVFGGALSLNPITSFALLIDYYPAE